MMDSPQLRRTINNEYAMSLPPPPPVFSSVKASAAAGPYTWVKPTSGPIVRSPTSRAHEMDRPREFKVIARAVPVIILHKSFHKNYCHNLCLLTACFNFAENGNVFVLSRRLGVQLEISDNSVGRR